MSLFVSSAHIRVPTIFQREKEHTMDVTMIAAREVLALYKLHLHPHMSKAIQDSIQIDILLAAGAQDGRPCLSHCCMQTFTECTGHIAAKHYQHI